MRQGGLVDQRLAKALSHPLRAHILGILNERVASPNEMAEQLEEPLGNVSYHVKALLELECIELVRTAPRRGALEHYYRALTRPFFSDRDWQRLPQSARQGISDVALQMLWEDVSDAIKEGSFESRSDRHLSRSPLVLDEEGWQELNELLAQMLAEALRIEAESAARMAETGAEGINTKLALMHFESPPPGPTPKRRSSRRDASRRRAR
jgi:DNA-binding transcriptional ArsR family regulator